MLPTVGLFRLFPCPYYVVGLCERPHCSFRHCRSDVEAARREASGVEGVDFDDNDVTEDGITPISTSESTSIPHSSRNKLFQEQKEQSNLEKTDHDNTQQQQQYTKSNTSPQKLFEQKNIPSTNALDKFKRANEENDSKTNMHGEKATKRIKLEEDKSESEIIDTSNNNNNDSSKSSTKIHNLSSLEKETNSINPSTSNISSASDKKESDKTKKSEISKSSSKSHHSSSRHSSSSSSHRSSSHSSSSKRKHDSSSTSKSKSDDKSKETSTISDDKKKSHKSSSSSSSSSKVKSSSSPSKSSSSKSKHSSSGSSSSHSKSKHKSSKSSSLSSSSSKHHKSKEKNQVSGNFINSSISSNKSEQNSGNNTVVGVDDDDDDDGDVDNFNDDINLDDYPSSPHLDIDLSEDVSKEFLYPSDEEQEDADRVALECFQMFQEYDGKEAEKKLESNSNNNNTLVSKTDDHKTDDFQTSATTTTSFHEPQVIVGKRRMAHHGADQRLHSSLVESTKMKPARSYESPAQQLLRRAAGQKPIEPPCSPLLLQQYPSSATNLGENSNEEKRLMNINKRRIAHVSNVCALVKPPFLASTTTNNNNNKSNLSVGGTISSSSSSISSSTIQNNKSNNEYQNGLNSVITLSQTTPKGERRVAHQKTVVSNSSADRPIIATNISTKVPSIVRQKILDQLYQECLKKYSSSTEAAEAAKAEEKAIVSKCNSKPVYMSSATSVITRLRREFRDVTGEQSLKTGNVISHHDILVGKSSNISFLNKKSTFNPVGNELYTALKAYLMTNNDLIENGYPRKHPDSHKKGVAIIKPRDDAPPVSDDPRRKTCDRCGKSYTINDNGFPTIQEPCTYHFGRRYARGTRTGNTAAHFSCCGGDVSSSGCCTSPCHVHAHKSSENFVAAVLDPGPPEIMGSNPWDVVACDCEMIYTTNGIELARATFVGVDGKVLYDSLVKPSHPVLDYNTRYSGITEELLESVKTTISDVQIMLLANLRPNTILIGHSLESDLIALKIIHSCVIDSSLVFPHKRGPPFKRALRNLCSEHLKKLIQDGDAGHDSAEDARSALDLILWKVKRDNGKGPGGSSESLDNTTSTVKQRMAHQKK